MIQTLLYQIIGKLDDTELSDVDAMFKIIERIGGIFGISILASIFETDEVVSISSFHYSSLVPGTKGFHETMLLLVFVSLVGFIMSLFIIKDKEKAMK